MTGETSQDNTAERANLIEQAKVRFYEEAIKNGYSGLWKCPQRCFELRCGPPGPCPDCGGDLVDALT